MDKVNLISFTIVVVCIVAALGFCVVAIWGDVDPGLVWKSLATLVLVAGATLGVDAAYQFMAKRKKEE